MKTSLSQKSIGDNITLIATYRKQQINSGNWTILEKIYFLNHVERRELYHDTY
jgi:hypothetical protein